MKQESRNEENERLIKNITVAKIKIIVVSILIKMITTNSQKQSKLFDSLNISKA